MEKIIEILRKLPKAWRIVFVVLLSAALGIAMFFGTTSCGVTVKSQMNGSGAVSTTVRQGVDSASVNVHLYKPEK